ncbi:uncharacterized protein K489DRAFT_167980 [Dissoconium aciculare CBS 342.82]|uniref:Uncharacterized protein n=1 Tax=Dissoconium aciculare CBS 342.82 TaxID=1314786 RepID=A0A6J3LQ59_9PEZI|nr:uncharacterized protein K489DRAFT_167980 [Dissoconium aciculare CBS 342.82]KAF1817783.1 hypothetical protein K489DRAFT_167980 [Dissoconium aciculare CBS 342.82]
MSSTHKVYLTESIGGGEFNHIALFIATGAGAGAGPIENNSNTSEKPSGILYNVIGTIVIGAGQTYEVRETTNPQLAIEHIPGTYRCIGQVRHEDLDRFAAICESIPVPGPQLSLRGKPVDPTKPVRRCTEWTMEAVEALKEAGILTPERQ